MVDKSGQKSRDGKVANKEHARLHNNHATERDNDINNDDTNLERVLLAHSKKRVKKSF